MKYIFWDDNFKGEAIGGYFIRNDLCKFLKKLQDGGKTPVGIKVDDSLNLEVIVKKGEINGNKNTES